MITSWYRLEVGMNRRRSSADENHVKPCQFLAQHSPLDRHYLAFFTKSQDRDCRSYPKRSRDADNPETSRIVPSHYRRESYRWFETAVSISSWTYSFGPAGIQSHLSAPNFLSLSFHPPLDTFQHLTLPYLEVRPRRLAAAIMGNNAVLVNSMTSLSSSS
jgi:hypothetical protein